MIEQLGIREALVQYADILFVGALAAQCDLQGGDQGGHRSAEFVGGVGQELPPLGKGGFQTAEHGVEPGAHGHQLRRKLFNRQPVVEGALVDFADHIGRFAQRPERCPCGPAGGENAGQGSQNPEGDERNQQPPEQRVDRFGGG